MRRSKFKRFIKLFYWTMALVGLYSVVRFLFPSVWIAKSHFPHVVYHGPKEEFEVRFEKRTPPNWVPLRGVSRAAMGAILVSEDWAFYQHPGYDSKQIMETLEDSIERGKLTRGASTITQQVAKNVFLTADRNLLRKLRELVVALEMEQVLGKRRILEIYLNIAEWGEGIFGIGRASQFYFGKHPSQLSPREGAFLAMLLPSPKRYSESYRKRSLTPYARERIKDILLSMKMAGFITEEERQSQQKATLSFEL